MVRFQADLYGTYCNWVSPIRIRNGNLRLQDMKLRLYVKEKRNSLFLWEGGRGDAVCIKTTLERREKKIDMDRA